MTDPITRLQLLRRAALGGAVIVLPSILAACGGDGDEEGGAEPAPPPAAGGELPGTITVSNWPLYIDVDEEAGTHPTLDQFTQATGIAVNYIEDINSNEEFFGKIQGPLSQGQSIDRDVIIPTAWMCARLLSLGWLEKLDKSLIPNAANLEDALASPSWDPNREYSLPWQQYFTGIGYDPEQVGKEITKVTDLFDPALKGKITLLNSMEDTIGLLMLELGSDPTKVDPAVFDEAIAIVQEQVDSGQVRQFTGNDYAPLLAKGDVVAAVAWSGDLIQLQASNPSLKFVIPDAGGMTSVDTMVVPIGGNVAGASTFMNFYYDPAIMAQVAAYVNYVPPVKGVKDAIVEIDPALAENELIFPSAEKLSSLYEFDAEALENTDLQEKWQAVIGA